MRNYDFVQAACFTPVNIPMYKHLIVIHWAAGKATSCINWFLNPNSEASAHYVVDMHGKVTQMVAEKDIAWHAGYSYWPGYRTDFGGKNWQSLNPDAFGIELEGPPSYVPGMNGWPKAQIDALSMLCRDIASRNPWVKLIDHSRIAPSYKVDVIAGTGREIDVFPWNEFIKQTKIQEA